MQNITIVGVTITPNPVETGQSFIISVDVRPSTHGFLKRFTHAALRAFAHKNIGYTTRKRKSEVVDDGNRNDKL